jgi:hypothetical protein
MSPFLRVPLGIAIVAVGLHMVWKTDFYYNLSGPIPFGEKHFGTGGTRFLLKLIGVGVAFIGMFVITNLIGDILGGIAGVFVR